MKKTNVYTTLNYITILYSEKINLHVSVKNEKPPFLPTYPNHFNLGIISTDHATSIYTLCCSGLMLNLNEKTPHTVRNILARDQPLTETDI
jgi:hypothetical protein